MPGLGRCRSGSAATCSDYRACFQQDAAIRTARLLEQDAHRASCWLAVRLVRAACPSGWRAASHACVAAAPLPAQSGGEKQQVRASTAPRQEMLASRVDVPALWRGPAAAPALAAAPRACCYPGGAVPSRAATRCRFQCSVLDGRQEARGRGRVRCWGCGLGERPSARQPAWAACLRSVIEQLHSQGRSVGGSRAWPCWTEACGQGGQ